MGEEVLLFLLFLVIGYNISRLGGAHFHITQWVQVFLLLSLYLEYILLTFEVFLTQAVITNDFGKYALQILNPRKKEEIDCLSGPLTFVVSLSKHFQLTLILCEHTLERNGALIL